MSRAATKARKRDMYRLPAFACPSEAQLAPFGPLESPWAKNWARTVKTQAVPRIFAWSLT